MASFGTVNSNENRSEYAVLKAGLYHCEIIGGEVKTSSNNGTYVEFTFRVAEGDNVNRQLRARFNIVNASQEAARIGKQQLIGLADAVGIIDPCDTDPFIGKHVIANVTVRPPRDQYGESNEIKGYRKYDGTAPASPSASAPASAPTSAPSGAKPSWLKK